MKTETFQMSIDQIFNSKAFNQPIYKRVLRKEFLTEASKSLV